MKRERFVKTFRQEEWLDGEEEEIVAVKRIQHGNCFEDFEIGREFEHHWGRTFGETDALWYANMTMQYNPIYFNVHYAKSVGYKNIVVHPLFVFATALGMSVEDLSEGGGPFLGVDGLNFFTAVHPGDTITSRSVVLSRRESESRPGWGIVEWRTNATNYDGEKVLEFCRRNLSKKREHARMRDHGRSAP
jgi:acyl dehydratase